MSESRGLFKLNFRLSLFLAIVTLVIYVIDSNLSAFGNVITTLDDLTLYDIRYQGQRFYVENEKETSYFG